jgi:hypothetical protein
MINAAQTIDHHETAKPDPLVVFRERAESRALLIANGYLDLQSAVDELWVAAERDGLVKTFGADAVQALLAAAFACDGVCDG